MDFFQDFIFELEDEKGRNTDTVDISIYAKFDLRMSGTQSRTKSVLPNCGCLVGAPSQFLSITWIAKRNFKDIFPSSFLQRTGICFSIKYL
ncbi:hypothetical protein QZH41_017057 [Actinostola sp. cb2023]|nr:hypothetical protein QZH41_017057 [Actinostola sp. cb2023]